MNQKVRHWKIWTAGISCVLIVVLGCSIFISSMNNMLKSNTLNTIHELAEHDLKSMETYLDENWVRLEGIRQRLISYQCDTVFKVQERLNLECASTPFYTICMVTDDGRVFNDRYMSYSADEMDLMRYMGGLDGRAVDRYDYNTTYEAQREMLLFAVPLDMLELQDARVTSLIALVKIQNIQDKMKISSFTQNGKSRGYSSVFDRDGYFVVNVDKNYRLNTRQNMFELLESGKVHDGWSIEKVKAAMGQEEGFEFPFTTDNGEMMQLYFKPVMNTDWFFVTMINNSVFTDVTRSFVLSSVGMVSISLVMTVAMAVLMINNRKKSMLASASVDARNAFLSRMSHEIRTPLNGVIGLLHLIHSHLDPQESEQVSSWVIQAEDTADYLHQVVAGILDMSRMTNSKIRLTNRSFLLDPMIDSIYSVTAYGNHNDVHLILEKDIQVPCIIGDEPHLRQILSNLLNNAVKFSPKGNPIWFRVSQSLMENHRVETIFSVQDTGIGISRDFMERMWEPFEQESTQVSNATSGIGLGLAISKGLADAMKAQIEVESKKGSGSTFTLRLVSKIGSMQEAEERTRRKNTIQVLDTSFAAGAKILVADDNDTEREVMIQMLKDKGFDARGAKDGQEVLDILSSSRPWEYDSVLLDLHLPVLDGYAACKTIRKASRTDIRTIPIFVCSASTVSADKESALRAGMDDFIPKPIHPEDLLERINLYHQFKYMEIRPDGTRKTAVSTKNNGPAVLSPAQRAAIEQSGHSVRELLGPESERSV